MKKFRIVLMVIFLTTMNMALAILPTSCPPYTAFSHVPGEAWVLSDTYTAQGWQAEISTPDPLATTILPPNGPASVSLSSEKDTESVVCWYKTHYYDINAILHRTTVKFTQDDLKNILSKNHNFYSRFDGSTISCSTVNLRLDKQCAW